MVLFEMSFGNDGNINIVVTQLNRELIQSVRLSDGVGVKDVEVGRRRYSLSTRVGIFKSNPRWVNSATVNLYSSLMDIPRWWKVRPYSQCSGSRCDRCLWSVNHRRVCRTIA